MIHRLREEGLSISAIARRVGLDRKTARKYLKHGLKVPRYGPRAPRIAQRTTSKPRSAIIVQTAAIRPTPAPTVIAAARPALNDVWVATSIAGPELATATFRKTSNIAS